MLKKTLPLDRRVSMRANSSAHLSDMANNWSKVTKFRVGAEEAVEAEEAIVDGSEVAGCADSCAEALLVG